MQMELPDYLPREDALAILTLYSSLELHYSLPPSSVSLFCLCAVLFTSSFNVLCYDFLGSVSFVLQCILRVPLQGYSSGLITHFHVFSFASQ